MSKYKEVISEWGNNRIIQSATSGEYILQQNVKATWLSLEQSSNIEQLKQSADEYQFSVDNEYNTNDEDEQHSNTSARIYPLMSYDPYDIQFIQKLLSDIQPITTTLK
jgi:hypothetical protein